MRKLAILMLLTLSACTAGGPAASQGDISAAVIGALDRLAAGIDRQDVLLASQPVGAHFFLGANVASRYSDTAFNADPNGGAAVARFRSFFAGSFDVLDNLSQTFSVQSVTVTGQVAVATVASQFDALRIDRTPPENVTFSTTDYMVFELERGAWLLSRWDETPPPAAPGGG